MVGVIIILYILMLAIMKGCSSMGAIFVLVIGFALLGITIYGFFNTQIFLNQVDERNKILYIMIVADSCIILGAILGIFGIKKGKPCCIGIFQILVIIFFFVFLGFAITALILPSIFFEGSCSESKNTVIMEVNDIYSNIDKVFCKSCNCALNTQTVGSGAYNPLQILQMGGLYYNSSFMGRPGIAAQTFAECPQSKELEPNKRALYQVLNKVENTFSCSGWCGDSKNYIYLMENVNKGRPTQLCYDSLKTAVASYGSIIGYFLIGISCFLFVICCCNICLCCHPERKDMPFSSRFTNYDRQRYERVGR